MQGAVGADSAGMCTGLGSSGHTVFVRTDTHEDREGVH